MIILLLKLSLWNLKKEDNALHSFATVPSKEDWKDHPVDVFVSLSFSLSRPFKNKPNQLFNKIKHNSQSHYMS